jgi:hypothetical protein
VKWKRAESRRDERILRAIFSAAPDGARGFLFGWPTVETVGYFRSCLRHWAKARHFPIIDWKIVASVDSVFSD